MGQLKNIQHEKFARALLTEPSQASAYAKVYKHSDKLAIRDDASRLASNSNVRNRVIELMNSGRLGLSNVTERLAKWAHSDDAPAQSMDAIKTAYKLHGVLDSDEKSGGIVAVQINIGNLSDDAR